MRRLASTGDDGTLFPPAAAALLQPPLQTPHEAPAPPHEQPMPPGLLAAVAEPAEQEREVRPGVYEAWWAWGGRRVRYLHTVHSGGPGTGPAVVCVHGFCGSASQWEANLAYLAAHDCRAYALDLLGACLRGVRGGAAGDGRQRACLSRTATSLTPARCQGLG